jgi:hypothetical protein
MVRHERIMTQLARDVVRASIFICLVPSSI